MLFMNMVIDKETIKQFSTQTIIAGIIMIMIGAIGIIAPAIMSLVVVTLFAWLFLASAAVQGYITYKTYNKSFSAWLKPVLSLIVGILLFAYPVEGIAATALLLSFYLLMDAFSSFGFAIEYKPNRGWWILIVNALISLLLALLILAGWPVSSIFWVGLYAGVSLLFDGIGLFVLGIGAKKLIK